MMILIISPLIYLVDVHAKGNEKKSFFNGMVVGAYSHFLALKELNIRSKPMTKSKRLFSTEDLLFIAQNYKIISNTSININ